MAKLPKPFDTPANLPGQQAVPTIRGYLYQVHATGLAWLDLAQDDLLLVEVAEDFAVVAGENLQTVQVRDTGPSGPISLRSRGVIQAIENLWTLAQANSERQVTGVYLSTAIATRERPSRLPGDAKGLAEWNRAQHPSVDLAPLRELLKTIGFLADLKVWINQADDAVLRRDLLGRLTWRLGQPPFDDLQEEFHRRVVARCASFGLFPSEGTRAADAIVQHILDLAARPGPRRLDRLALDELIQTSTLVLTRPAQARTLANPAPTYVPPLDLRTRDDAAGRLFFFGAGDRTGFVGRDNELGLLTAWAAQRHDFSWTLVTGVGGMGKSRLALELCLRLVDQGWHAGFLAHGTVLTQPAQFAHFRPSRPTLLVIDYVSLNTEWAGEVVRTLVDLATIEPFAFPVRVLLLERTGAVSPWFYDFSREQQSRLMGRASRLDPNHGFITLDGLKPDDRWSLFKAVLGPTVGDADWIDDREWRRGAIETALGAIDPAATPLFTVLAAESARAGRQIWQFSRQALLNDIFLREQARWRSLAADPTDLSRHERAAALATMVGGYSLRVAAQAAADVEATASFPFDQTRYNGVLAQAINGPAPADNDIVAMEPDILGEWFVLRRLAPESPFDDAPRALRTTAGRLAELAAPMRWGYAGFRARLAQDFPDQALGAGLYEPPPIDAPSAVQATWLALMANVMEDLADAQDQLASLFAKILAVREAFASDPHVQVNAVAAIGIYWALRADTAEIAQVADLIDATEWPQATLEFAEAAAGLSRAMLIVGRALAAADETQRALAIFETLRLQAWRCRTLSDMPAEPLKHDAARLGLHIRASFQRQGAMAHGCGD